MTHRLLIDGQLSFVIEREGSVMPDKVFMGDVELGGLILRRVKGWKRWRRGDEYEVHELGHYRVIVEECDEP